MWFFPSFGIRPGRKVLWSKVLQVLQTRGSTYEQIFPRETFKKQSSPKSKGDHPELDDLEFIYEEERQNSFL